MYCLGSIGQQILSAKKGGTGINRPAPRRAFQLRLWLYPPHSERGAATTLSVAQGVVDDHSHL